LFTCFANPSSRRVVHDDGIGRSMDRSILFVIKRDSTRRTNLNQTLFLRCSTEPQNICNQSCDNVNNLVIRLLFDARNASPAFYHVPTGNTAFGLDSRIRNHTHTHTHTRTRSMAQAPVRTLRTCSRSRCLLMRRKQGSA